MLISHPYRFVFIKTVKTAGTSVEAFLEPFCCPPGHVVQHWTPTLISDYGVVGQRWPQNDRDNLGYYNHMPAAEIRMRCSQFDDYTRLTVVRDPYDRAISYFHFSHPTFTPPGGMPLDQAIALLKQGDRHMLQERFVSFLRHGLPDEQALLCIEGRLAVQRWIRFEALHQDLEQLVHDLGLPLEGSVADALPGFKRNRQGREDRPGIDDYLSAEALEMIDQQCGWSFDTFNYQRRSVSSFS